MRVVVAPDCFGGTLTAREAAAAIARGWAAAAPRDAVVEVPLSDGGPGLVEVLAAALPDARRVPAVVTGPHGRPVPAEWLLAGTTAYVESAAACGLHLLTDDERDPRTTTTRGVGELVGEAAAAGVAEVVVGLGGSGTNDGGGGLLAALGAVPLDRSGAPLPDGGAALAGVTSVAGPVPALPSLVAATDVDAPLLGLRGASAVYGPQKGASRDDVQVLDAALERWADALEQWSGRQVRDQPGAGAAGGLGAALMALGARRAPGLDLVADLVRLDERLAEADLVVTGEGRFDATSLRGKVVGGVARRAQEAGLPCVVLAGQSGVGRREASAHGVDEAHALSDLVGLDEALRGPAEALEQLAARVARQWSR